MATTASDWTTPTLGGHQHFLLRRLHSLTGIIFGGYLIVHLVVNATIIERGEAYQTQVNKIHQIAWLPVVEWIFIFLPIIYHTIYGIWIFFTGQPNNGHYPYKKNWFYLFQRISAVYILGFLAFHVLSLKYGIFGQTMGFDPEHAQSTIVRHFHFSPLIAWIVYPLGVLASAYHTANGFWTAAVTWGITIRNEAQRNWGWVCFALFILLFAAGMVAIFAAGTQPLAPAM